MGGQTVVTLDTQRPMNVAVGPAQAGDGESRPARGGSGCEVITGDIGARYAEQAVRGNAFVWRTETAQSIPALGNNSPCLWNPAGSGVVTIVTGVAVQAAAIGTPAVGGLQLGYLSDAGANIGTGSPVATATFISGVCTAIGLRRMPRTLFAGFSITFATAPALLCGLGLNAGVAVTEAPYSQWIDLGGRVVLHPGGLIQLASSAATSKTYNVTFFGYEIPRPATR